MRPTDVPDVDALDLRQLEDLEPVRRDELPRPARRLAAGVRLGPQRLAMARVHQRPGPVLERNGVDVNRRVHVRFRLVAFRVDRQSAVADPDAVVARERSENHAAIGPARRRARGRRRRLRGGRRGMASGWVGALGASCANDGTAAKTNAPPQTDTGANQPVEPLRHRSAHAGPTLPQSVHEQRAACRDRHVLPAADRV